METMMIEEVHQSFHLKNSSHDDLALHIDFYNIKVVSFLRYITPLYANDLSKNQRVVLVASLFRMVRVRQLVVSLQEICGLFL